MSTDKPVDEQTLEKIEKAAKLYDALEAADIDLDDLPQRDGTTRRDLLKTGAGGVGLLAVGSAANQSVGSARADPKNTEAGTIGDGNEDADFQDITANHVDSTSIDTGRLGTATQYASEVGGVQAAHDALPASGGKIIVDETIVETGITLTKSVTIEGVTHGDSEQTADVPVIDKSGGDGIEILASGVTLRDLKIVGDNTGGYGIKQGAPGVETLETQMDGVVTRDNGGVGYIVKGETIRSTYTLTSRSNSSHGYHIDLEQADPVDDFFNGNSSQALWLAGNGGDGMRIEGMAGTGCVGNEFSGFVAEGNSGHAIVTTGSVDLRTLTFTGYGEELNSAGAVDAQVGTNIQLNFDMLRDGKVSYGGSGYMTARDDADESLWGSYYIGTPANGELRYFVPLFMFEELIMNDYPISYVDFFKRTGVKSTPPAGGSGDIYLDDGTNTASGNPALRAYVNGSWHDMN